jgi:hypothetical protein
MFVTNSVAYLGHVISASGVAGNKDKVATVESWPRLGNARALRGVLGLAGYYRRIIRDFGTLAAPRRMLLRKEGFQWSDAATTAFKALKKVLSTAPVLHLPDFERPFMVDCDASGTSFSIILHHGVGRLAFYSKPFAARHLKVTAYERVQAVHHSRPNLWGRRFIVCTDKHTQVHVGPASLYSATTLMD